MKAVNLMKIGKTGSSILIFLLGIMTLAGCGNEDSGLGSGRVINKDGSIEATIVREFDETLYNVDELKSMMDDEISSYNFDNAGDKITAGEVKCEEGILTCVINYAGAEDYAGFNNRRFVIETYDEALASDIVKISVKNVKDLSQVDFDMIEDNEYLYVLVTDETGVITFPGKVLYISDGVESISKNKADVTENMDGLAYIIYKNK